MRGFSKPGLLAAVQDHGIPAERFALVPNPGPDWAKVAAALIDGVDVVAVGTAGPVTEATVRALQARAREKGTELIPAARWPTANAILEVVERRWEGLGQGQGQGQGQGRLRRQDLQVLASGRGAAARPRTATVTIGKPARTTLTPETSGAGQRQALMMHKAAPSVVADAEPDLWSDLLRGRGTGGGEAAGQTTWR